MMAGRILYRTRQFWHYLAASPASTDLDTVKKILEPPLLDLFLGMSPEEQAHSINILHKLLEMGENNPDLLAAALLHDVGKNRFPLKLRERVLIVLCKMAFPRHIKRWGAGNHLTPPLGFWKGILWRLKKPLMVAEQHPRWGAEMAFKAGANPLVVSLIRRHQEKLDRTRLNQEVDLLLKLQMVDDES
jgi:hypothetical protein